MPVNRREFVILTCAAAAGCASQPAENAPIQLKDTSIDAGPASDYASEGIYSQFRSQGFFLVRRGESLFALSSICTHRRCPLQAEPDHSLHCKCHGSDFDETGHVLQGPATVNLPRLPTTIGSDGHLRVLAVVA